MLYTLRERGPLLLENGRDPYNVYIGSHWILTVCCSPVLGCTRRFLAQNRALGPYTLVSESYMPALGSKCQCWVVDAGVRLKTEVLGHTRWRWVTHTGIGFETSGLLVCAGIRLNTSVSVHRDWRWVVLGRCHEGCCRCVC